LHLRPAHPAAKVNGLQRLPIWVIQHRGGVDFRQQKLDVIRHAPLHTCR
jgi:hypothetical protein